MFKFEATGLSFKRSAVNMHSFKAKTASPHGYHVFKETSWSNAKEGDEIKVRN